MIRPENWREISNEETVEFLKDASNPKRRAFSTLQKLEQFYRLPLLESTTAAQALYGRNVRMGFVLALASFLGKDVLGLDLGKDSLFYSNLDSTSWIAHGSEEVSSDWLGLTGLHGTEFFLTAADFKILKTLNVDQYLKNVPVFEMPEKIRKPRISMKALQKKKEDELFEFLERSPSWLQERFLVTEKLEEFFELPAFKSGSVRQLVYARTLRAGFLVDLALKLGRTLSSLALPRSSAFYTKVIPKEWCEQAKSTVDPQWLGIAGCYPEGDYWVSATTERLIPEDFEPLFKKSPRTMLRLVK